MLLYKRKEEVHNMNENKRMLIFFVSIILVIAVVLIIAFWPEPDTTFACGVKSDKDYSKLGAINYQQYECLMEQDNKNAIAISDGLSDEEKENLNKVAEEIGKGIYYISDEVSNSDLNSIKKDLKFDKISYDNSSLVVVENAKISAGIDKNLNKYKEINQFLKDVDFVKFTCNTTNDSEYENLAKLTYDQYDCLYNSDEPFVMVVTQSTCHYCEQFLPVINDYAAKNDLPVYFLEIDTMDQTDAQNIFSTLTYFSENSGWGTPLTLAIKDKEVVTELSGYTDDTTSIDNLFKEIGLK